MITSCKAKSPVSFWPESWAPRRRAQGQRPARSKVVIVLVGLLSLAGHGGDVLAGYLVDVLQSPAGFWSCPSPAAPEGGHDLRRPSCEACWGVGEAS